MLRDKHTFRRIPRGRKVHPEGSYEGNNTAVAHHKFIAMTSVHLNAVEVFSPKADHMALSPSSSTHMNHSLMLRKKYTILQNL